MGSAAVPLGHGGWTDEAGDDGDEGEEGEEDEEDEGGEAGEAPAGPGVNNPALNKLAALSAPSMARRR
jgi:hypothetical protein